MKTKTYLLRMTPAEKRKIERGAKQNGMSVAAYLRYLSTLKIEASLTGKEKGEVHK